MIKLWPKLWKFTAISGQFIVDAGQGFSRSRDMFGIVGVRGNMLDELPERESEAMLNVRAGRQQSAWANNWSALANEVACDINFPGELACRLEVICAYDPRDNVQGKKANACVLRHMQNDGINGNGLKSPNHPNGCFHCSSRYVCL
jgi:hypothetical protein